MLGESQFLIFKAINEVGQKPNVKRFFFNVGVSKEIHWPISELNLIEGRHWPNMIWFYNFFFFWRIIDSTTCPSKSEQRCKKKKLIFIWIIIQPWTILQYFYKLLIWQILTGSHLNSLLTSFIYLQINTHHISYL